MLTSKILVGASLDCTNYTIQSVPKIGLLMHFYLAPLSNPKRDLWYLKTPLGHNVLRRIVNDIMREAGFEGHYTNHLLRVSLATRLFDTEVDEQMSRTGHSSTDGVRAN